MAHTAVPELDPELAGVLVRNREQLVRRWLALVVERSTLAELAERPLSDRVEELDVLFRGGATEGTGGDPSADLAGPRLAQELMRRSAVHADTGEPFAVALVSPARATAGASGLAFHPARTDAHHREWAEAVRASTDEGQIALEAGNGATAVVFPGVDPAAARGAADRLRVAAWRRLRQEGPLADLGVAACPADGTSPHELLSVASERLRGTPEPSRPVPPRLEPPPEGGDVRVSAPMRPIRPS